jgi:glycerophosphoryl diester phosphodiesterase
MHALDPSVALALLVDNDLGFEANLARLSFVPDVYSPHYRLVDAALVRTAHARGLQVIPWTVNDVATMRALLELGVDGLITDYPDRAAALRD